MSNSFISLGRDTFVDPEQGFTRLRALFPEPAHAVMILTLGVTLNVLFAEIIKFLYPEIQQLLPFEVSWLSMLILVFLVIGGTSVFIAYAGGMLDGRGDVWQILLFMGWLQVLQFAAQVILFATVFISPVITQFLTLGMNLYFIWLSIKAVDIAHEFNSMFKSLAVTFVGFMGVIFSLVILAALLGVGGDGGIPNV